MSAYYVVVQYSPGLTGEIINLGVVTYNEDGRCVRFLKDWSRVQAFVGKKFDLGYYQSLEKYFTDMPEKYLRTLHEEYMSVVKVTRPRGSLLEPVPLMENLVSTFLVEPDDEQEAR